MKIRPKTKGTAQDGHPHEPPPKAPHKRSTAQQGGKSPNPPRTGPGANLPLVHRPYGNTNAFRHGLRSSKLPKTLIWAERRTNVFRQFIEAAVMEAKGEITLIDASSINTAIRWERHAILAGHYLNKELDSLTPDQRLSYSREVANASTQRDKCLRALGIDSKVDPWNGAFDGSVKQ